MIFKNVKEKSFYNRWKGIKMRCNNPKRKEYKYYGYRGIKCLWGSFKEFKQDMWDGFRKHIYKHGLSDTFIERINNDGHYCKENCRWATNFEQSLNKRLPKTNEYPIKFKDKLEGIEIIKIKDDYLPLMSLGNLRKHL